MLEYPSSVEDLYLASSREEVERSRPVLTGDVFEGVTIPGVDERDYALILTHPCSMRKDGVNLVDRLLMARVTEAPDLPLPDWATGHFKVMPLPALIGRSYAARFDEIGLVQSSQVQDSRRVACLTPFGINLLQQRFIWHLTRFLAPTHRLNEASASVFEEADLCEEWVMVSTEQGRTAHQAETDFHEWIRTEDESGTRRQSDLADPQRRAGIRREMRRHLQARSE